MGDLLLKVCQVGVPRGGQALADVSGCRRLCLHIGRQRAAQRAQNGVARQNGTAMLPANETAIF